MLLELSECLALYAIPPLWARSLWADPSLHFLNQLSRHAGLKMVKKGFQTQAFLTLLQLAR